MINFSTNTGTLCTLLHTLQLKPPRTYIFTIVGELGAQPHQRLSPSLRQSVVENAEKLPVHVNGLLVCSLYGACGWADD